MNYLLCSLIVFLCTLDGYIRLRAIFALFFVIIFLILNFKFIKKLFIVKKHLIYFSFLLFLFLFYTFLSIINPEFYLQIPFDREFFVFKIFDRLSLVFLFLLLPFIFIFNHKYLNCFRDVAYIHVFFFLMQFILFYVFSIKIDLTSLFGVDQRTNFNVGNFDYFRASGLYVEPSNYAAYIAIMFFPYLYLKEKLSKWDYIPVFTMFLTLSTVGFLIAIFYSIGFLIKNDFFRKIKGIFIFFIFLVLVFIFLSFHIYRLNEESGTSSNLRSDLLTYVVESRSDDVVLILFGTGIYSYDNYIYQRETSSLGRDIASIQDFTMFLYNFITLGLVGVLFLICLLYKTKGLGNKFFVIAILASKITYLYPIFIFFIIYILYSNPEREK